MNSRKEEKTVNTANAQVQELPPKELTSVTGGIIEENPTPMYEVGQHVQVRFWGETEYGFGTILEIVRQPYRVFYRVQYVCRGQYRNGVFQYAAWNHIASIEDLEGMCVIVLTELPRF